MATRVTPLRLAVTVALVATLGLAGSAMACDGHSKAAAAAPSCCAAKSATAAACAKPVAAPQATTSFTSLAGPAPVAAPFASLPHFAQPAPIVAGLMAFIDPETGMLTGPIGDLQVPADVARVFAAPADLTPVTLPNGAVVLDLQGTLMDNYVLTIDPLGRRTIRCVQDARKALAPAAPVAPSAPVILPIAER
jgi:hypothetical protein